MSIKNPNEPLEDLLKNTYPEISKAIKNEGYNLEFQDYDVFNEIPFENKVAGFVTFKSISFSPNHFWIMDAYVIPEYRGNNLLFNYLFHMFTQDNFEFYPRKPTKAFVNVLLKNDFASKLTSDIVVSYFKFMVDIDTEIYKNSKIKRFYKKPIMSMPYKANLFDMDLCSAMFRDPQVNFIKTDDFLALSEPRKYDLKRYKCRKELKRVSEKYLNDKYNTWALNIEKIRDFIQRKDKDIAYELSPENLIGSKDKLSDDFIELLDKSNLSIDDGFKIRKHVLDKLDSGQLNEKSYIRRFMYLMKHFEAIDKNLDEDSIETCPFCGKIVPDFLESCGNCGLVIREINLEMQDLNDLKDAFLKNIADMKDGSIEENLKEFYNSHRNKIL